MFEILLKNHGSNLLDAEGHTRSDGDDVSQRGHALIFNFHYSDLKKSPIFEFFRLSKSK